MGSCLWFYDSEFDNGAGQPAGKWCNLELSNFEGDSNGKWFFWDTNNSGFFVVNTDLSQHPCGDISDLIDDLNFPNGSLGSAFNTVMTQQRLDEPDNLLIDIKDLAVQAFDWLKDKAQQAAEAVENTADHPGTVKSPMVGTVYTAPEPDAPTFITEGDSVSKGQTLLIVEAMKVMNPITAPQTGTVVKIFVQNAQPVEFGESLVIVE